MNNKNYETVWDLASGSDWRVNLKPWPQFKNRRGQNNCFSSHQAHYLNPLLKTLFVSHLFISGRRTARSFFLLSLIKKALPEIEFNSDAAFPFSPQHIPRVKNRKYRRACYQSFALYKKSFQPIPTPKLNIIWNELKTDDMADAVLYAFAALSELNEASFREQYVGVWLDDNTNKLLSNAQTLTRDTYRELKSEKDVMEKDNKQ